MKLLCLVVLGKSLASRPFSIDGFKERVSECVRIDLDKYRFSVQLARTLVNGSNKILRISEFFNLTISPKDFVSNHQKLIIICVFYIIITFKW